MGISSLRRTRIRVRCVGSRTRTASLHSPYRRMWVGASPSSLRSGFCLRPIAGIDVTGLLQGAAEMERRCRAHDLEKNPAGMLATLLHRAHVEDGEGIHVLMPYSDRLRSFGLWFQQLWAESLGKGTNLDGEAVETGPTPLPALGATDQHSLLQLLMEGPRDKVVCFISVETSEDPVAIPDLHPGLPTLAYLGGHTLRELIDAERAASAEALRRQSRPNLTIRVPVITAETVGQTC